MTEASLLFPILCILLSATLTAYLYHASIEHASQASFHLSRRLAQYIHNKIRHNLRALVPWFTTVTTGNHVDNIDLDAGEYELIESSSLHPGLIISPPDVEPQSSFEVSPRASSLDSASTQGNTMTSEDEEGLSSDWYLHQSRILPSPAGPSDLRGSVAIDMEDLGIRPADWEIDRISRINEGGLEARVHRMVDRVVNLLQTDFEADVAQEFTDYVQEG